MITTKQRQPAHKASNLTLSDHNAAVARKVRDQALAAGLTITTYKEGQLIKERLVGGKINTLIRQHHEDDDV